MTAQLKNLREQLCEPSSEERDARELELYSIATKMHDAGLSSVFIVNAVHVAMEYDGVADLMSMWIEEENESEKNEIVADIQEMIEACEQEERVEDYINFNDLDAIAKDVRSFKDSLYQEVIKKGGISKLADSTGIPQPSLSRFFGSNSMPRRSTVLKIANALNLKKIYIDTKWSK